MKWIPIVTCATCVAAGPTNLRPIQPSALAPATTAPAVSPEDAAIDAARRSLVDAEATLARTTETVRAAIVGSEPYASAKAEADRLEAALEQARTSGTRDERMAAASAFGKAKLKADGILSAGMRNSQEIRDAAQAAKDAQLKLAAAVSSNAADAAAAQAARDAADPIKNAIRRHEVIKGMTKEQAIEAMGRPADDETENGDNLVCVWREMVEVPVGLADDRTQIMGYRMAGATTVRFRKGMAIEIERSKIR